MIQEAIHKVINRQDLTYEEAVEVMGGNYVRGGKPDPDGHLPHSTPHER